MYTYSLTHVRPSRSTPNSRHASDTVLSVVTRQAFGANRKGQKGARNDSQHSQHSQQPRHCAHLWYLLVLLGAAWVPDMLVVTTTSIESMPGQGPL